MQEKVNFPNDRGLKSLQDNINILRNKLDVGDKLYQFLEKAKNRKNKNEIEKAFREKSFISILHLLENTELEELNNYFQKISQEEFQVLLAWIKEYEEKLASQKNQDMNRPIAKTRTLFRQMGDSDSEDDDEKPVQNTKISLFEKLSHLTVVREPVVHIHTSSVSRPGAL